MSLALFKFYEKYDIQTKAQHDKTNCTIFHSSRIAVRDARLDIKYERIQLQKCKK